MSETQKCPWDAEERNPFIREDEKQLHHELGIKSRRVLFKIPRDRIIKVEKGEATKFTQIFKSNNLPKYVEGTVEETIKFHTKRRVVVSLQPLEFKDGAQLELHGANGWKNGIAILNYFCDTICKQPGVVNARNMTLSDLIGTEWKKTVEYTFKNQQYSIESFLKTKSPEAPGTSINYPTWEGRNPLESGMLDECLQEETTIKCMNFWLATRVAMPVETFKGDQKGLLYSIAYYDNAHICMDSGLFGTNGEELGYDEGLEWRFKSNVRPVIMLEESAFHNPDGPIIIPD